ncbi:MAG: hypothetical protein EA363_01600 [Balneolaceae bacterium]|nr:MAG: hypothetical protein EA363_01600 [Balneolaceae bacterium]
MVTEKMIKKLIRKNGQRKVTMTMPTEKIGESRQQNPIRFKNLLSHASGQLMQRGMKEHEAATYLQPARELLGQPLFWSNMEHGMVVYIADDYFEVFKLPYEIKEMVYVNRNFRITPLLPMISTNGTFCVLAISQENVRLLRCTRTSEVDITPEDIPVTITGWLDELPQPHVQFHTGTEGEGAKFFGHGSSEEDRKEILEQYFRDVEKGVTQAVKQINDPLLLAGLKTNLPLYKKVNNYNRVLENALERNPDDLTDAQLRDHGWDLIRDYFLEDLYQSVDVFQDSPSERISSDPSEIITATVMGKSAAIFIKKDLVRWGKYDDKNHKVLYRNEPGNDDVDLMNWLSIKGLETGSNVYILSQEEMPNGSDVAALFRF